MNIVTANRLVQYRKQRGMSQEELAATLGLSRQAVSKWERAEASPDTDNLIALARLYGVSLDTLLLAEEPPQPMPAAVASPDSGVAPPEPPPAAPGIDERLEQEVTKMINDEITDAFADKEYRGAMSRLSPAARRLVDLMLLGAFLIFFVVYGLLSLIFPSLNGAFPLICTILYLLMGFFADWWHPGWMIYLSLPLYYMIF